MLWDCLLYTSGNGELVGMVMDAEVLAAFKELAEQKGVPVVPIQTTPRYTVAVSYTHLRGERQGILWLYPACRPESDRQDGRNRDRNHAQRAEGHPENRR